MRFTLNNSRVPNGTVLLFRIKYDRDGETDLDATRGRREPKVFTYAMLKAGGLWYVTGAGQTPQAAGWRAVERWLERDGRRVVQVDVMTATGRLWPAVAPEGAEKVSPPQA